MSDEGPSVDRLIHRLAQTPGEFTAEPLIGRRGSVRVDAVVNDLVSDLGGNLMSDLALKKYRRTGGGSRNRARLILVAAWLLHDEWFREKKIFADKAEAWLGEGFDELSRLVAADLFVTDADRREELARLALFSLGLIPEGETKAQAADRLNSLGSVQRNRVIEEIREKERRAEALRKKMAEKRARESAAKANREW